MRYLLLLATLLLGMASLAQAADYHYISAEEMKNRLENGSEVIIVDIQVEQEFNQHHLPGAVPTYAYPVKTEAERGRIDRAIEMYKQTGSEVVIVCPRGKGGAKRCYDYMAGQSVPPEKLHILENGMSGWPYKELVDNS